jgi:hypothetical protein
MATKGRKRNSTRRNNVKNDADLVAITEKLIERVVGSIHKNSGPGQGLVFPHGITKIDVTVELKAVGRVAVSLEGPQSSKPLARILTATPQQIIDACEDNWDADKSDCSKFVKDVVATFGVTLTGQANDIVDQITSQPEWQQLNDGVAAKQAADNGQLVIAGLRGSEQTPPEDHGHVVVVVSGPLANNKYPSAYWGRLGGVGEKNKTINFAWKSADRDAVHYACRSV